MTNRETWAVFTFALILTFIAMWASAHYAFKQGVRYGEAHPIVRFVPIFEVIKQNDACVCAPTIFRGTFG